VTSATVDSNVLVSALVFGGRPLRVLELALEGGVRLDISGEIFSETFRVMSQKFKLPPDRLRILETYVNACTSRVEPTVRLDVVKMIQMTTAFWSVLSLPGPITSSRVTVTYCA
jgi:hypothetical protein